MLIPQIPSLCSSDINERFVLCHLTPGKSEQWSIDLGFGPDEEVHFHLTGKCAVHLTGFYEMDNDDDDDDDEGMEEAMARNEGEGMYDEDDDDDDLFGELSAFFTIGDEDDSGFFKLSSSSLADFVLCGILKPPLRLVPMLRPKLSAMLGLLFNKGGVFGFSCGLSKFFELFFNSDSFICFNFGFEMSVGSYFRSVSLVK